MKLCFLSIISAFSLLSAVAAPYVVLPGKDWQKIRFNVTQIKEDSILDFSKVLNHHRPAGKYGRLKVVGEHFEFEKLPGVKQRFFGVNLCCESTIPPKEDAALLAESIARAGYNSVRLHHYDNYIIKKNIDVSTELDPEKIDRVDYFIKQCKDRGIYVTIDLYCTRQVTDKELPEVYHPVGHWNYKNAVYLLDSAKKNFLTFTKNLMTHKNPYTGLTYAEDPVFCFISTLNENHISKNWDPKNSGARGWQWESLFVKWCKKKGIPKEKQSDLLLRQCFIKEYQKEYSQKMQSALHNLGIRTPLTDLNNGGDPFYNLLRMNNDYTDMHYYMGFCDGFRPPFNVLQTSWIENFKNKLDYMRKLGSSRIFGRPYTITELRWCKPCKARGEGGVISGALAGFQDWDALYTFQWAYGGENYMKESWGGLFDLYGDPIGYLSDRMVHLLFLRGDVAASKVSATLVMPKEAVKLNPELKDFPWLGNELMLVAKVGNSTRVPSNDSFYWDINSKSSEQKLVKRLEGITIGGKGIFDSPNCHFISSTGELELIGKENQFRVATPRSEAVVFVGTGSGKANLLSVENRTPYTTFFASAMDGNELQNSKKILFLHLNDAAHVGMNFEDESMKKLNSYGYLDNQTPHLARRATGEVTLTLDAGTTPKVYAVNLKGERLGEIASTFADGRLKFTADTTGVNGEGVLVYEIIRENYNENFFINF